MVQHLDRARLDAARDLATQRLLALRNAGGSWHGRLSSSPLATAAAISALVAAEQHVDDQPQRGQPGHDAWLSGVLFRTELNELVIQSLRWLGDRQNPDGGWGDAEGGPSTIPATMMVQTAFQLTAVPAKYAGMMERAEAFLAARGGASGLRRSHYSPTLVASVLAAAATAEVIDWREVPRLRIERVLVPPRLRRWIGPAPTGPLAPAVMALGLARAKNWPSRSPLSRLLRRLATPRNVEALGAAQGQPGDFHGSPLATSFVVMGLAAARVSNEWIVRRGVEFLLSTVRSDGSWAAESNRAVANTAEAALALDWELTSPQLVAAETPDSTAPQADAERSLRWLIAHQHGPPADPNEAGWTASNDLSEAPQPPVTAKVIESLAAWQRHWPQVAASEVQRSTTCGVRWLLARQRDDGGWSSGRRGAADADVSSADATADVIRALAAVRASIRIPSSDADLVPWIVEAIHKGSAFLTVLQDADGSWASHSYGSTSAGEPANRVIGTARAVGALVALGEQTGSAVVRGADWLSAAQQASGGWGPAPRAANGLKRAASEPAAEPPSTVEETSEAVEALAPLASGDERLRGVALRGVARLCDAAEAHWIEQSAPLVLGGDGLWFGEQLLPLISAVAALRSSVEIHLGKEPATAPNVEMAARE